MGLKLVIGAVLGALAIPPAAPSIDLYDRVRPSLRMLITDRGVGEDGEPKFGLCTATAVAPQRYITAAHCFDQTLGAALERPPAEIILRKVDKKADLALVVTEEEHFSPALTLAERTPAFGTPVVSIGFHMGSNPPATFFGRVMGGVFNQRHELLFVDASGNVGSSGGAIVDEEGKLVGMILGGVNPPSIATYGAKVETIRRFLK